MLITHLLKFTQGPRGLQRLCSTTASQRWQSSMAQEASFEGDHGAENVEKRPRFTMSTERPYKRTYTKPYINHAPVLFEWSQKLHSGALTLDQLVESSEFRTVSNEICDTIRHSDSNLLNLIKSVLVINLDPSSRLVRFLEEELLYKIEHRYDFRLLGATFGIYHHLKDSTPRRAEILEAVVRKINEKLDQEQKPQLSDLLQLIKLSRHLNGEILLKLEEHLTRHLDGNEDIALDNLCYLLVLLSRYNRRNKNLIRAVVAKLLRYRAEEIYTMPPHLIHMISSLNRLNYPEINLLEKCSDILINLSFLEKMNESSRRDFIVSISHFNFSYPKLNEYFLHTLLEQPELFKRQDLITLTITLARLNYQHDDLVGIVRSQIVPRCPREECISKNQWFNYVYSLVLLRAASLEQVRSIFDRKFIEAMEQEEVESELELSKARALRLKAAQPEVVVVESAEEADVEEGEVEPDVEQESPTAAPGQEVYQVMNIRRKYSLMYGLLTLEPEARLVDEHTGAPVEGKVALFEEEADRKHFEESYLASLDLELIKCSKDMSDFRAKFTKTLEAFAPSKNRYLATNLKTPFGFKIDAELLMDLEGKPQVIPQAGTAEHPEHRRVALMCIGFNDTLLDDSSTLIGPKEAERSILRSLGYLVVPVHQNSIPSAVTSLNRVKFVQNLIVSHLKNG